MISLWMNYLDDCVCCIFFFKQKTAYEVRISDWSSDVCSSDLYRNERAVEFAYEGVYWFDIRRWKRAHLKDGTPLQALSFQLIGNQNNINNPVDNENVTRVTRVNFVFKDAHYWLPFLQSLTRFSADWERNPGW